MEKLILVAVYDMLRFKGEQHLYLKSKNYLGVYYTEPIYDLYSISKNYGGVVKNGNTSILTEIYSITENDLLNLDYFYGINVLNYTPIYNKKIIQTSYGECVIYLYNKSIIGKPKIESGDYIKWKENLKKEITIEEKFTSRHSIE